MSVGTKVMPVSDTTVTQSVRAVGAEPASDPQVADLDEVISSMKETFAALVPAGVDCRVFTFPGLWRTGVERGRIGQVLLILVANACKAMPAGGKLTVETANVVLSETFVLDRRNLRAGPHVLLAVSDSGAGAGGGREGLDAAFDIIGRSGGSVWVYSEPGQGTTFKVYLPVAAEPDWAGRDNGEAAAPNGLETILLVDDDEPVRLMVEEMLADRGYTVMAAAGPADALRIAAMHHEGIDLLVTDVVMPLMSGPQLAGRLAASRPQLKVLYMSGYADNAIVRNGILGPGLAFFQKPVTPAALARKVREVLDGPGSTASAGERRNLLDICLRLEDAAAAFYRALAGAHSSVPALVAIWEKMAAEKEERSTRLRKSAREGGAALAQTGVSGEEVRQAAEVLEITRVLALNEPLDPVDALKEAITAETVVMQFHVHQAATLADGSGRYLFTSLADADRGRIEKLQTAHVRMTGEEFTPVPKEGP